MSDVNDIGVVGLFEVGGQSFTCEEKDSRAQFWALHCDNLICEVKFATRAQAREAANWAKNVYMMGLDKGRAVEIRLALERARGNMHVHTRG